MDNRKLTKRALVASVLAVLICIVMLVGTTFAWFTDNVINSGNKIQAGTLDIELEELVDGEFVPVGEEPIFNYELWEPGYSDYAMLKVKNNGSLALKYALRIIANGDAGILGDVIDVYFMLGDEAISAPESFEAALEAGYVNVGTLNELIADEDGAAYGSLLAGESVYAGIVLHMQEEAGNEYQGLSVGTTFDICLFATQFTYEADGFGSDQYDADAEYNYIIDIYVNNFEELKAAFASAANGAIPCRIILGNDIPVEETINIMPGTTVTLDMNGKTLTLAKDEEGNFPDPMFDMKGTDFGLSADNMSNLTITGNGTVDLEDNYYASFIFPRGNVTIENGSFLRDQAADAEYGSYFVGISGGIGRLIIYDGYFDGGYYAEGDCFNNCRNLLNCSWGQYIRVYGGTFVAQNPAWADEGMAIYCPHCKDDAVEDDTDTHGYCQGIFLEGQVWNDFSGELPAGYTVTESVTEDGRPTYTVTYVAP